MNLPAHKAKAIVQEFGDSGKAWVANYRNLLDQCIEQWSLKLLGMASAGLDINVIFFCEDKQGRQLVLKIGHPHPEQGTEIIALRHYALRQHAGRHVVRIVDWNDDSGAFLMDRIRTGDQFRRFATDISRSKLPIPLFAELSIPAAHIEGLPTYQDWLEKGFAAYRGNLVPGNVRPEYLGYMEVAESVFSGLCKRHPEPYLLHGDLHHENILQGEAGQWIAIDPKGVIGPRILECGRFVHNFIEDEIEGASTIGDANDEQIRVVLQIRLENLSNTMKLDRSDIAAAGYVDLVLGTCWSINSKQKVDQTNKLIKLLGSLL
ncbi:MAG: aminoglycoside phosphotransferase family protein [Pseudomonadales bacterium]